MICLTGDVHHLSMKYPLQKYLDNDLHSMLGEYLNIAKGFSMKSNLFITGKTFVENNSNLFCALINYSNLEINPHGYYSLNLPIFKNRKLNKYISRILFRTNWIQSYDIKKVSQLFREKLGLTTCSWRTHAFHSNINTLKSLQKYDYKIISDEVSRKLRPYYIIPKKLVSLPINTLPDHTHLFYAYRNEEWVKNMKNWRGDAFGKTSYPAEDWLIIVKNQVQEIVKKGGIATLLVHPEIMYILDKFKTFINLCDFLSRYESIFVSDSIQYAI